MKRFFERIKRAAVSTIKAIGEALHFHLTLHMQRAGMILGVDPFAQTVPDARAFEVGRVTSPDQSEVSRSRLYDYQLYPTAGQTQLSFYTNPIGSGITTALGGTVGTAKTKFDTNMQLANQLPSGKAFKVESIEVYFWAGSVSTANTYTPAPHNFFAAVAAVTVMVELDDVDTFYQSGLLQFGVLDKIYVEETPLGCFPPQTGISYSGAVASNSATTAQVGGQIAQGAGRVYELGIPFTLLPAQNFFVNMQWPGAVATPSGFNARCGVVMNGWFMRATQ
jgi:hypothetical protein